MAMPLLMNSAWAIVQVWSLLGSGPAQSASMAQKVVSPQPQDGLATEILVAALVLILL
jgi:hypothetical protein